jgi:hypothetical protein
LSIKTSQLFFDDEFYFTYTIKESVKILLIGTRDEASTNLSQLYAVEPYYDATYTTSEELVPEDFVNKELVVIQHVNTIPSGVMELLDGVIKNGGTVVLIPGENLDAPNWNSYLARHQMPSLNKLDTTNVELTYFNSDDPLYLGVFESKPANYQKPQVYSRYRYGISSNQSFMTLIWNIARKSLFIICTAR